MAEWHRQEESKRRARHTKEVARGTRDRKGAGRIDNDSSSTAMEESKVEMANRVARFQVDYIYNSFSWKVELRVS